ncbi:MAG TPA: hypothetical protein VGN14_15760 [Candidatus Elarobacter sp.]|jgi:hypothetical protein
MLLFVLTLSIIVVGLLAIAHAHPSEPEITVWNDESERRLLRERKISVGWW